MNFKPVHVQGMCRPVSPFRLRVRMFLFHGLPIFEVRAEGQRIADKSAHDGAGPAIFDVCV
jgi:hypothetical protein